MLSLPEESDMAACGLKKGRNLMLHNHTILDTYLSPSSLLNSPYRHLLSSSSSSDPCNSQPYPTRTPATVHPENLQIMHTRQPSTPLTIPQQTRKPPHVNRPSQNYSSNLLNLLRQHLPRASMA
ncbi:unnamed protein product [Alternaria burnsii]|nr:unnamed protein product [Alternaria burnsii]